MTKKLIVSDGERERQLLLVANLVVGRDPVCDISDPNSLLSRRHAEFVVRDSEVLVRDLGSRNGVYVNGAKTAEGRLRSGDLVRIGHLELRYVEDATPLSSALAAAAADSTGVIHAGPPPRPLQSPLSAVRPAASGTAPSPPAPVVPNDEEERTRLVRPPSAPATPPPASAPAGPAPSPPMAAAPDDEERTRLVRPPTPAKTPTAPAAAIAIADADEEERTRLVRPPVRPTAPATANLDADERTMLVRPQSAAPPQGAPALVSSPTVRVEVQAIESPGASGMPPPAAAAARHATVAEPQTTFVFVYSGVLAVVVAVATAALLLVGRGGGADSPSVVTIGGVAVVVIAAAGVIGSMLAARVRGAVAAGDRGRD